MYVIEVTNLKGQIELVSCETKDTFDTLLKFFKRMHRNGCILSLNWQA